MEIDCIFLLLTFHYYGITLQKTLVENKLRNVVFNSMKGIKKRKMDSNICTMQYLDSN